MEYTSSSVRLRQLRAAKAAINGRWQRHIALCLEIQERIRILERQRRRQWVLHIFQLER